MHAFDILHTFRADVRVLAWCAVCFAATRGRKTR
jgi:hypothetical protein